MNLHFQLLLINYGCCFNLKRSEATISAYLHINSLMHDFTEIISSPLYIQISFQKFRYFQNGNRYTSRSDMNPNNSEYVSVMHTEKLVELR